jgi:hypothetical protein
MTMLGCHRHPKARVARFGNLAPASERQNHTTSPSALATFVRRALRVHRIPASRFVTIGRNVPLHRGGMRESMVLICPTRQAKVRATDWHDGQFVHKSCARAGCRQASARAQRGRPSRGTVLTRSTVLSFGVPNCPSHLDARSERYQRPAAFEPKQTLITTVAKLFWVRRRVYVADGDSRISQSALRGLSTDGSDFMSSHSFDIWISIADSELDTAAMLSAVGDAGNSNCSRLLNARSPSTFR